jgi:hypothetical protein
MSDITKTSAEYAKLMFDCCLGNVERAQCELYESAKAFPMMPNKFWYDCHDEINKLWLAGGTDARNS